MPTTTPESTGLTLTKMTAIGRVAVKGVIAFLVVMMVGRLTVTAAINYWKATHPEPPPPPTVGFGKLPSLQFPEQLASEKPSSYVLETPTGGFPNFGDRAKVFLMTHPEPSLLADDKAKTTAQKLGFTGDPESVTSSYYRWNKFEPLLASLDLDINTLHFSITTDYLNRPEILYSSELPTNFDAVNATKSFLSSANLLPPDAATSSGTVTMLRASGTDFVDAVALSDADVLQVDIHRTPIDGEYAVYTPDKNQGTIHAIIGRGGINNSILEFEFAHHAVDYAEVHTYPLRTPDSAWQVLKAGEGYIADMEDAQAVVRSVELGYYDTPDAQSYLQPIYVFKGDGNFLGYVSALDPQFVQSTTQ